MTVHPTKVNWWYESIVDWMLMNPQKNKGDCAKFFNVSKQWMYVLTQSDVFKTLYEERRKSHAAMVSTSVIEKTSALTEMAQDLLIDRMAESGSSMTPQFLKDVTEMGLEKLGYNGKGPTAPNLQPVNLQVNVVSSDALAEARLRMQERGRQIAEQTSLEPPPGSLIDLTRNEEVVTPLDAFITMSDDDAT